MDAKMLIVNGRVYLETIVVRSERRDFKIIFPDGFSSINTTHFVKRTDWSRQNWGYNYL